MSRMITSGHHSFTEDDKQLRNTQAGKLLFSEVRSKLCALLIQSDRITAAQVLDEANSKIGAIYVGKVKNVVKNIDACFVEIADSEICFLPMKETKGAFLVNRTSDGRILEGDELLVQITKDAYRTKQAMVTAQISVSNEVFAFSLGKPGIGYSNKFSKTQKEQLKQFVKEHGLPEKLNEENCFAEKTVGMVIRTKAGELSEEQLLKSFQNILTDWVGLIQKASHSVCFSCIKKAASPFEAVLQQLVYPNEYMEILTDDKILYEQLKAYVSVHLTDKTVRLYEDETFSLKKLYSLDTKLNTALDARIWLKGGGYLIIEPTEAMTVIDVNSGKYETKKANQEAIYKINCEAAEEIALQLRLRNLSGIIIVDFINMDSEEKQEELLELLRKAVHGDKQKTVVVDMTPLGLVEITRKKGNKTLREQFL